MHLKHPFAGSRMQCDLLRAEGTLEAGFCLDAVNELLAFYGKPGILTTDQGSQFTGAAFTGLL